MVDKITLVKKIMQDALDYYDDLLWRWYFES